MIKQQLPGQRIMALALVVLLIMNSLGGIALGWLLAQSDTAEDLVVADTPTTAPPTSPTPSSTGGSPAAGALEAQFESIYQQVGPSVVNITSRSLTYDFFLNPVPREGTGSGFFYDRAGHIVTNYHVIAGAEEVQVALANGQILPAEVVGVDPSNDLAVIKVDLPEDAIPAVRMGDSTALGVGQFVVAIGNPFGLERTLTVGIVSSLGRIIESPNQRFIGEVIQTDAAINPGNSGGPLLNLRGEVVGVNTAILSPSGTSAGIGFAIPARTVQRVVAALIEEGRYRHPSLGVRTFPLTPQRIEILRRIGVDVPVDQGLLIAQAVPGGAADQAGLRGGEQLLRVGNILVPVGGDIITAIDGHPMTSEKELNVYLETQTSVGQTVEVTFVRDGEEQTRQVTLAERREE